MTETGPTVFLMDAEHARDKVGSVGKPQILAEVRVVDDHGRDLPDGQAGELLIRGPGVTPGYWNNRAATRAAFTADGWLRTGDVARRDVDGYYFIVDRIKDMYISGGENVYPAEVERVVYTYPGVQECAVVGVPNERWGEVGCAFVLPAPGASIDAEALRAFCRQNLAAYKVPKTVVVVDDFPRTAAGKIRKHVLRTDHRASKAEP
jgi:fatty-acyl-CoA synthase